MCAYMQITGVGTVLMLPLIGSLSDVYGRKALLTLPMTISIIPLGMHCIVILLHFAFFNSLLFLLWNIRECDFRPTPIKK